MTNVFHTPKTDDPVFEINKSYWAITLVNFQAVDITLCTCNEKIKTKVGKHLQRGTFYSASVDMWTIISFFYSILIQNNPNPFSLQ